MKEIQNFIFTKETGYYKRKVKMIQDLDYKDKQLLHDSSEKLTKSQNLIDKMRKFKTFTSTNVFDNLVNRRQTQYGCLKLESFAPNEIIKSYGTDQLDNLRLYTETNTFGINQELFILFNFELFKVETEEDYFFQANGQLTLFVNICSESKRIKSRVQKKYLLEQAKLNSQLYKDINPDRMTKKEYMNSLFFRTKYHKKINLNVFIDENIDNLLISREDILFHFLNAQKFQLSHISLQKSVNKGAIESELTQNNNEEDDSQENDNTKLPNDSLPLQVDTDIHSQFQKKSKKRDKGITQVKKKNTGDLTKLVKGVKFNFEKDFNNFYMQNVLDVQYMQSWNMLLVQYSESKEIKTIDLTERKSSWNWKIEKDAHCINKDWFIISMHYSNEFDQLILALSHKKMVVYFVNPDYNFKKPKSYTNKILRRKPIRIETVYMPLFMSMCSYDGVILNVSENHDMYFWYSVPDAINYSEFQHIEISYKKVKKTWNKIYTLSFTEIESQKWVAFSCFDGKIRLFDSQQAKVVLEIDIGVLAHTLKPGHADDTLIVFTYEKNFEVIEINQYYKDSKSELRSFGHISLIIAAEYIAEHNLVITSDDLNLIKTWDLKDMSFVQSFKIKQPSLIQRIISLGKMGFLIQNSNINLFTFDLIKTTNYNKIDFSHYELNEQAKGVNVLDGDINVIPKLQFTPGYLAKKEFFFAISNEVRSYYVDNGLVNFRYLKSKIAPSKHIFFTSVAYIHHPIDKLVLAMSNGDVILIPEKKDDLTWSQTINVFSDSTSGKNPNKDDSNNKHNLLNAIIDVQIDQKLMNLIVAGKTKVVVYHLDLNSFPSILRTLKVDYREAIVEQNMFDDVKHEQTPMSMSNDNSENNKSQSENDEKQKSSDIDVYIKKVEFINKKNIIIVQLSNEVLLFLDYRHFKFKSIYSDTELKIEKHINVKPIPRKTVVFNNELSFKVPKPKSKIALQRSFKVKKQATFKMPKRKDSKLVNITNASIDNNLSNKKQSNKQRDSVKMREIDTFLCSESQINSVTRKDSSPSHSPTNFSKRANFQDYQLFVKFSEILF